MAFAIALYTDRSDIEVLVAPWLADARLPLNRELGIQLSVDALPDRRADAREVFNHGNVYIRGIRSAGDRLDMEWGPGLGFASLAKGALEADVVVTRAALERPNELLRVFLLTVCILLLRNIGLHHVHSATLRSPAGDDWLLSAMSRSGKSTTTALLARNGWRFGTDDIAFLRAGTDGRVDVVAWHDRLALRPDMVAAAEQSGGTDLAQRDKTGWFAEELGSEWISSISPSILAFPSVGSDKPTALVPMPGSLALTKLMESSPWVMLDNTLADEHLRLLSRLVKQTRNFNLSLGRDFLANPGLLAHAMDV